jgi:hypothetical protein
MNPNVLTAAINAGAAVITAVVALLVSQLLDKRIDDLRADSNRRLERIETDLKEILQSSSRT